MPPSLYWPYTLAAVAPSSTSTPMLFTSLNLVNLAGLDTAFHVDVATLLHCPRAKAVILSACRLFRNTVPSSL
jgi:hypothetical protein